MHSRTSPFGLALSKYVKINIFEQIDSHRERYKNYEVERQQSVTKQVT